MITNLNLYRQYLTESNNELIIVDELKDEMNMLLSTLDNELNKASKNDNIQNEGLLTTASIVIALPAILGLISRIGKIAGNLINKVLGKKPSNESNYQQWMDKLSNIADQLHHLYLEPIEKIVSKFVKDHNKAHNIANGIFHIIVATLLIASGATAIKAFHAKNVSLTTLESALTAIKSGEIKLFITNLFNEV